MFIDMCHGEILVPSWATASPHPPTRHNSTLNCAAYLLLSRAAFSLRVGPKRWWCVRSGTRGLTDRQPANSRFVSHAARARSCIALLIWGACCAACMYIVSHPVRLVTHPPLPPHKFQPRPPPHCERLRTLVCSQGRVCRPLFVVENNRLRIRKKHINDLHDPNYGWTNLMQQVGGWPGGWIPGLRRRDRDGGGVGGQGALVVAERSVRCQAVDLELFYCGCW